MALLASPTHEQSTTQGIIVNGNSWQPFGALMTYCYIEQAPQLCKFQFSLALAIAVLTCNIGKVCAISVFLGRYRQPVFVTFGDAMRSFLDEPIPYTDGFSKKMIDELWRAKDSHCVYSFPRVGAGRIWKPKTRKWGASVSGGWVGSICWYVHQFCRQNPILISYRKAITLL